MESTLLTLFLKASKIKWWLANLQNPSIMKEIKFLFDKTYSPNAFDKNSETIELMDDDNVSTKFLEALSALKIVQASKACPNSFASHLWWVFSGLEVCRIPNNHSTCYLQCKYSPNYYYYYLPLKLDLRSWGQPPSVPDLSGEFPVSKCHVWSASNLILAPNGTSDEWQSHYRNNGRWNRYRTMGKGWNNFKSACNHWITKFFIGNAQNLQEFFDLSHGGWALRVRVFASCCS